jgi:hypothetical protein
VSSKPGVTEFVKSLVGYCEDQLSAMEQRMESEPNPEREPTRQEIDQMEGPVLVEFGTEW